MKNTILLFATIVLFCSCGKSTTPQESHLGKWKLMMIASTHRFDGNGNLYQPPILDFSKDNIVFEFKEDGILMVSEDIMSHDESSFLFQLEKGRHVYSIEKYGEVSFSIKINDQNFSIHINNGRTTTMRIGRIGVGGFHLVKVEK